MSKETEIPRPSSLTQRKEISFSFLADRIGRENAGIIWRHLSPEAFRGDSETATCCAVKEARKRLSGEKISQGLWLFASGRGKVSDTTSVIIGLDMLASMLAEARGKPSIIDALTASEELPAASPFTVKAGRRSELPEL